MLPEYASATMPTVMKECTTAAKHKHRFVEAAALQAVKSSVVSLHSIWPNQHCFCMHIHGYYINILVVIINVDQLFYDNLMPLTLPKADTLTFKHFTVI